MDGAASEVRGYMVGVALAGTLVQAPTVGITPGLPAIALVAQIPFQSSRGRSA